MLWRVSFSMCQPTIFIIININNQMRVLLPGLIILILACTKCSTIVDSPSDLHSPAQVFFNRLFQLHNLRPSQQLHNCLTDASISTQTMALLHDFARNGSYAGSAVLPRILAQTLTAVNRTLPGNIVTCVAGSNDLRLLLYRMNISVETAVDEYERQAKSQFLDVHYGFNNISAAYGDAKLNDTERYQKIAELVNSLAKLIYLRNGAKADNPWTLRAENIETMSEYFGVSVSNGVLGVVSSRLPLKLSSTVLAGAYDKIGRGRVDNLVETFSALNMQMHYSGGMGYSNYIQEVDMAHGCMTHSLSTAQVSVTYTYYTLQNVPNVFYTKFAVTAHEDGELTVKNLHEAPETLINLEKYQEDIDTSVGVFNIMSSQAKTKTGKLTLVASSSYQFSEAAPMVLHEDWDSGTHLQKFRKSLKKGEQYTFAVITSLMSSQNHDDPINEAIRMVIRVKSMSNILEAHNKRWQALWQSDIIIEGNDQDQKYVRSMLYHFYSFTNSYKSFGLSPMGLSGLGYNGHVFWDMDLWMYPAILVLKPSLAKSLINYRVQRLAAAKNNAFLNGYKGAMFPWESSQSGSEETPVWALSGPLEHHISGCVALGAWNYYLVTQDKQWLAEKGYPIIEQVAQFFESRVELGADGNYHINNVVGADEWAQNIDDDAFTNGVAKVALQIANKAAKVLGLATTPRWDELAQKIVILKMANGVTKEHSRYNGQNIKQADVNLLAFPLNIITKPDEILKDVQYYETRVPDGGTPAMTFSIFSLLYTRLKNTTMGYRNFRDSFVPFLRKPFGVFAETKGGSNPYFMTGAGGVLQSVIFGFGGFDITDQGVVANSQNLPSQWKKLTIKSEGKVKFIHSNDDVLKE